MAQRTRAQRLTGLNPLAYMGVEPTSPQGFYVEQRAPTINDRSNFTIGDIWLDIGTDNPPQSNDIYMLTSLSGGIATWVNFGGGILSTLTGNDSVVVSPNSQGNINVIGNTSEGITITGNSGTSTLTATSVSGHGFVQSLTGDSGGAVYADTSFNINLLGTASHITTAGNPGTNTVTIDIAGAVPTLFTANTGTATPSAHNLNIFGSTPIVTAASGDTVTVELTNGTNGQLLIGGGSAPTWANLTSSDGSVIITNGANSINLSATNASAASAFFVSLSTTQTNVTGDATFYTIPYDVVFFDVNSDYSVGGKYFTAPYDGVYVFYHNISYVANPGGGEEAADHIVNNSAIQPNDTSGTNLPSSNFCTNFAGVSNAISYQNTAIFKLNAGDQVESQFSSNLGAKVDNVAGSDLFGGSIVTFFYGYLLYRV